MFENEFHIATLIHAQLKDSQTPEQRDELEAWIRASSQHRDFYERFIADSNFKEELARFNAVETDVIWTKTNLLLRDESDYTMPVAKNRMVRFWSRIAVAASVILLAGVSILYFEPFQNNISRRSAADIAEQNDIVPGSNGATLTLANGKKIDLSDAAIGTVAHESGVKITKDTHGQLVYTITDNDLSSVAFNTLETFRGEQIQVKLPDGTTVWLNAASVLKYPASFSNRKDRLVQLSGEAYFEVSHDKEHPFTVQTTHQEVEVLGTHFNISSYAEDAFTKTTLLEGKVRINQYTTLNPGQQATSKGDGPIQVEKVDVNEAMDWKNGKFICENVGLPELLTKIARWYDVEFEYQPHKISQDKFTGTLSRTDNISVLLRRIELTGEVEFRIEGRKVYVRK